MYFVLNACLVLCQFDAAPIVGAQRDAWVARDGLEVLAEPDATSQITARLKRGTRLFVREGGDPGWLKVEPPPGSFSWIERSAIELVDDERARVVTRVAAVRPGSDEAALPAGVWTILRRGDVVELLDKPPLVVRQPNDERRVWYAVTPPVEESRYVRADGTSDTPPMANRRANSDTPFDIEPTPRDRSLRVESLANVQSVAAVGPPVEDLPLDPDFRAALGQAEARHRGALAQPIESWSLDAIRAEYQRLPAHSIPEKQAVDSRLAQIDRQVQVAKTARELAAAVGRTQRIDREVAAINAQIAEVTAERDLPFEVKGLLQSSSTLVDGRTAYLLIDDRGRTAAYVVVQPGLSVDALLARRVGIRGESRYHGELKARVVTARQVVPLDDLE